MMPFEGGLEGQANGALVISFALASVYLAMLRRPPSVRRTFVKAGAVALLAWLVHVEGGPALLVTALVLGAIGDAFLAQDGERAFTAGLASFLASHVAYVVLLWSAGGGVSMLVSEPWRLLCGILAAAFGAAMLRRLVPALPVAMRVPVAVYVATIVTMGLAALTLPVPLVIAGAAAFMASDAILAVERFLLDPRSPHRTWTGPAVWILYWMAQATIAVGVLTA